MGRKTRKVRELDSGLAVSTPRGYTVKVLTVTSEQSAPSVVRVSNGNWVLAQTSAGIVPVKSFPSTCKYFNLLRSPSSVGIVLVSLFPNNHKSSRFDNVPIEAGMVPVKPLSVNDMDTILWISPMNEGIVPTRSGLSSTQCCRITDIPCM